ncbi:NUDIX domain-containing protein [Phenylobacterium montanum]|uniref:GDP-mannose pyrophosphatase n=1 Tax=Phenylobacterium montanum TaxID=2823693 RepID=A0A975G4W8_9CAUL|nr:NUDIX hydrolase [Caulobacter sp. S6]QUD90101.1 NUDIX hydrolase [Caulobacter sp. S6]
MTQKPDWTAPAGEPWVSRSEQVVYENPWITVREHQATAPTGRPALYGVVSFKNLALAVLPLHEDGTVTLVGQHRFPLRDYVWEIPEGGGPMGEDPLAGAQRELREETGLVAAEWRQVLRFQLSNSITDERGLGFVATGLTEGEAAPDETEVLQVARVPFREALGLAVRGEITDALTVAMLLRAYHMAQEGELSAALSNAMLRPAGHP